MRRGLERNSHHSTHPKPTAASKAPTPNQSRKVVSPSATRVARGRLGATVRVGVVVKAGTVASAPWVGGKPGVVTANSARPGWLSASEPSAGAACCALGTGRPGDALSPGAGNCATSIEAPSSRAKVGHQVGVGNGSGVTLWPAGRIGAAVTLALVANGLYPFARLSRLISTDKVGHQVGVGLSVANRLDADVGVWVGRSAATGWLGVGVGAILFDAPAEVGVAVSGALVGVELAEGSKRVAVAVSDARGAPGEGVVLLGAARVAAGRVRVGLGVSGAVIAVGVTVAGIGVLLGRGVA